MTMLTPRKNNMLCVLLFFTVLMLSFFLRFLGFDRVFVDGSVYLFDPDCYIKLRKVYIFIENFPKINIHDYYQGFPVGTDIISPPILEYVVAGLILFLEN